MPSVGCTGQIYGFSTTWQGTQLKSSTDTVEGTGVTYGYDDFNRLTAMNNSGGASYAYGYDRYGNRWSQSVTSGSGFSFNPTYVTATNQISIAGYTYDAAGNLMSDGTNTYSYDADGNLIAQATNASGSTIHFTYNALNQQVAQSFPSGTVTDVVFDKSGNLASLWLASTGAALLGKAYWGGTAIESYSPSSNVAFFTHRNWVGTRRAVTTATGGTKGIVGSLPFGDDAANVTGGTDNSFDGFTGLWAGGTNNTNHAQFREYWNIAGRWLQPDPFAGSYHFGNPQSFNRYAYALNNPLRFVDPAGLAICYYGSLDEDPTDDNDPSDFDDSTGSDCSGGGGVELGVTTTVTVNSDTPSAPDAPVVVVAFGVYGQPTGGPGGSGAPSNQCQTTGPSGSVLVGYGGQVDAGTGLFGIAATGNAGGGLFYGNGNGFSAGAQISGGAAGYAGGSVAGAPSQSGQPFSFGAYAGASPTVTFTNARSVQQLSGPFTTWTLNLGSGPVTGSLQLSYSNGIWEFSIGLPVPRVSPGIGASVSKLTTQTATTKTGCGSGG